MIYAYKICARDMCTIYHLTSLHLTGNWYLRDYSLLCQSNPPHTVLPHITRYILRIWYRVNRYQRVNHHPTYKITTSTTTFSNTHHQNIYIATANNPALYARQNMCCTIPQGYYINILSTIPPDYWYPEALTILSWAVRWVWRHLSHRLGQ